MREDGLMGVVGGVGGLFSPPPAARFNLSMTLESVLVSGRVLLSEM